MVKLFIALDVRKWSLEMPEVVELITFDGLIAIYEGCKAGERNSWSFNISSIKG